MVEEVLEEVLHIQHQEQVQVKVVILQELLGDGIIHLRVQLAEVEEELNLQAALLVVQVVHRLELLVANILEDQALVVLVVEDIMVEEVLEDIMHKVVVDQDILIQQLQIVPVLMPHQDQIIT